MMTDKNLFLYDLAVVAILKNEGHYLKEWLDYHLLAGVDHFYLYDNDSTDNQAEVAVPYIRARLVDYIPLPGKAMQYVAYNDAVKRFKFHCRYMAFIDGDEFIYPKNRGGVSVIEVVDEILSDKPHAAGLAINWQCFGSNGHDKADYSRGVLERFTRRAPKDWAWGDETGLLHGNIYFKSIMNPRCINFFENPHGANYLETFYAICENGKKLTSKDMSVNNEKIVINHYYIKSREEFADKVNRGSATRIEFQKKLEWFESYDRNEVFDDGILKYLASREENFSLENTEQRFNRVIEALIENLSREKISLETALTCRALSTYLREHFPDDADYWRICEEKSLAAILKSIRGISFAEVQLFIRELPNLLSLPYPAVKEIHRSAQSFIGQMINVSQKRYDWASYMKLDYLQDILRSDSFD